MLEVITPQPDFPRVDLTEENAEYLTLVMANHGVLQSGHMVAETTHPIFPATHSALTVATEHLFDRPENLRAIEFGIRGLEAITLFVLANPLEPELKELKSNIVNIMKPSNIAGVYGYFERVHEEFLHETPRTAAVIAESAARYIGSQANLAVFGGAVARQFELDNAKD